MPLPLPPSVKDGRMIVGKPMEAWTSMASSSVWAMPARGDSRPISCMARRNSSRSSAVSMASREAPIISTPNFSRMPSRSRSRAVLRAVWPPMVGSSASGRSRSITRATVCQLTGSM